MEGHGGYNRSSRVQAAGSSPALPLLEQAARIVTLAEAPTPIVIADYGASEGRNSLDPMAVAIGALRDRVGPERAISVIHTDLPFSSKQPFAGRPRNPAHQQTLSVHAVTGSASPYWFV